MAKITKEKYLKINGGCANDFQLDLQYYLEDYLKNGAKSNNSYEYLEHKHIKVNSCGIAKDKKENSVIY